MRIASATRGRLGAVALALVLAGALALGVVQVSKLRADADRRQERADVVSAASAEVLALTNISATTTDEQIQALLGGMTEHLKGEFAPQADSFRQAMVKSKVQSHGRVIAVGVTSLDGGNATAVVAAGARVSNARTKGDQERSYRLSLSLQKVGQRWLVNTMDFVS